MTADLEPDEFLAFCEREKQVILRSVSTTKHNGIWRVEYEDAPKTPALPPSKAVGESEPVLASAMPAERVIRSEAVCAATEPPTDLCRCQPICFDCGQPYEGKECPVCSSLARIQQTIRREQRDRQLERRFGKPVDTKNPVV
jgi:hypothetical protein